MSRLVKAIFKEITTSTYAF